MSLSIANAYFVKSASDLHSSPASTVSEVVFLGRSNVGKSSLLNALTKRKGLAKTSSTPGKTRLINFFGLDLIVDDESFKLMLVDLPGFGYAKVSKAEQEQWQKSLAEYLRKRVNIRLFVQLIDARHPSLPQDKQMSDFVADILRADQISLKVFTKIDKLNRKEREALKRSNPNSLALSSQSGENIDELLATIVKMVA